MTFDEAYQKYYRELYAFSIQSGLERVDIDDLLQDVFCKLYKEIKEENCFENTKAWLYKVLINQIKTFHTTNNRRNEKKQLIEATTVKDYNPHINNQELEKVRILNEGLQSLSDNDRNLLSLYNQGFSYTEMAEITGIAKNSVGKTLARAIEKLKKQLKNDYYEMFE